MNNQSKPAIVNEIWAMMKEYRKDMNRSRKEAEESRKRAEEDSERFRKDMEESRKKAEEDSERFRKDMEESRKRAEKRAEKREEKAEKDSEKSKKEIEEIWKLVRETSEQIKETDKQIKKTDARFDSQWGKLIESLVEGRLVSLLNERGIEVQQTTQRTETSYKKEDGDIQKKEFDILAVNGIEVVVVEVKTTLRPSDVRYFLEAMNHFKKYCKQYKNHIIYGAVAYLRSASEAHVFAERQGLFIIRATGDSASIINKKDFKPKVFDSI